MPQTLRRLPGISFETQAPPSPEVLPRMDVAGFVGFASSGPIDVPVPVEDPTQFAQVFGVDAPLAWDPDRGEQAYAFLGPAVRAFFRNGGRRCWVVRVADRDAAATDVAPLPGIAAVDADGNVGPAQLVARSPGSWADSLRVSASLEPTPIRLHVDSPPGTFDALVASPSDLVAGDVVRVTFASSPWTLVFAVGSTAAAERVLVDGVRLARLDVTGADAWWIRSIALAPGRRGHVHYLGARGAPHVVAAAVTTPRPGDAQEWIRVSLDVTARDAPPPGTLLRAVLGSRTVWIDVADLDASHDGSVAVVGTPFQVTRTAPPHRPHQSPNALAEKLTLRLSVDTPDGALVLAGLGFAPAHARFAGKLPADAALYGEPAAPPAPGTLAFDAAHPRFPLAAGPVAPALLLPLGASILPGPALPAIRPADAARHRDGLARFDADLFWDDALADSAPSTLLEDAFWIRDQQRSPRALRGMHALLAVDEVTIVSVPDAVQRPWYLGPGAPIPAAAAPEPPEEPDWSRFLACSTHVPATPVLSQLGDEETGAFTLLWSATDVDDATYELRVATEPDFADAETLYEGPELEFSIYGRPRGSTLYYEVRAVAGGLASGWSNPVVVRTTQTTRWFLEDVASYSADALARVQLALLRMCAARGDMLAVLALPEHYREPEATAYVHALKPGPGVDPIFSYGSAYHPWLYTSDPADPTSFRRTPPDGAATGVMASRAFRRGAWVAPANEPLRDVVDLDPPLGPDAYRAFQDAQVNLVRQDPGGFLWLAADTLSDDPDLRPVNVRRLLQVLRRAALLHGAAYAFEPNDAVFRRTVQRAFEGLLSRMFSLGAFAGATASDGFRVDTGSPPNTPESVDEGRLIVELRVAPSRPLAFLTVRLRRTGAGALQVETR